MVKWTAGVVLALVGVAWGATVSAQGKGIPAPFDTIVTMLTQIQASLASVSNKVDSIDPSAPADVVTGPLQRASTPVSNFKCMVVNTGTADADVTIEIRDQFGGVEDTTSCPGLSQWHVCAIETGDADQVTYCRVTGLSAKTARVTLCAREAATCVGFVTAP